MFLLQNKFHFHIKDYQYHYFYLILVYVPTKLQFFHTIYNVQFFRGMCDTKFPLVSRNLLSIKADLISAEV